MSHIIYIVIVAVVIAALGFLMVFLGEKNEANRDVNDEKCNGRCQTCPNIMLCNKPEKIEKRDEQ